MRGNIQNIHISHNLDCFSFYKTQKNSRTQLEDSCDMVNFVFWQRPTVVRLTPVGGRQYVVSVMEQERRVSVCCIACRGKVELGGRALGYRSCRVGQQHPHTLAHIAGARLCARRPVETHTNWAPRSGRKRPPHRAHALHTLTDTAA